MFYIISYNLKCILNIGFGFTNYKFVKPNPIFKMYVHRRLGLRNTSTASLKRNQLHSNECPAEDTKQSDCEAPVLVDIWGMRSTPSLPSLPDPLWAGVEAPRMVLSMGQIEVNCVIILN